jgi:hypothetical protein
MKQFLVLLFMVSAPLTGLAQKETTTRTPNRTDTGKVAAVNLTKAQRDWLNLNYKKLAGLRKDNAIRLVKETFPALNEATMEFLIGQAAGLAKQDEQKLLQEQLEKLRAQKQALLNKIIQKKAELGATSDTVKEEKLRQEILGLEREVALLSRSIEDKEAAIRRLREG